VPAHREPTFGQHSDYIYVIRETGRAAVRQHAQGASRFGFDLVETAADLIGEFCSIVRQRMMGVPLPGTSLVQHTPFPKPATSTMRLLLLAVLLVLANASRAATLESLGAIPLPGVKGGFDLMSIDGPDQRFFLAAEGNGSLEILDLKAAKRIKSIGGMDAPKWVVYRPESHRLFVSNGDGKVRVFSSDDIAEDADHYERVDRVQTAEGAATSLLVPELDRLFLAVPAHDTTAAELRIYRPVAPILSK